MKPNMWAIKLHIKNKNDFFIEIKIISLNIKTKSE